MQACARTPLARNCQQLIRQQCSFKAAQAEEQAQSRRKTSNSDL
jgi:hypothetical protein